MSLRVVVLTVVLVVAMVAGCSSAPARGPDASPSPTIDTRPVVDAAPYYCTFIPQEAFRRVTGITTRFTDFGNSGWVNGGDCNLQGGVGYGPLSLRWSEIEGDGEIVLDVFRHNFDSHNPVPLPRELGEAYVVYAKTWERLPYKSISWFHCGKKHPWIAIYLAQIAPGRDAVKDLTELMRIAQKRYGQWKKCTPKP